MTFSQLFHTSGKQRHSLAIQLSNKAINNRPSNKNYLERNGYLKWKSGDLKNAATAIKYALKLDQFLIVPLTAASIKRLENGKALRATCKAQH